MDPDHELSARYAVILLERLWRKSGDDFDPPHPHPVASIGWRFVHLIGDNEIYMEYAFGPGLRSFPDLPVHGTADEVLADWENSCRPVTAWLASARDSDLLEPRPSHLGGSSTAGDVMTILLDEQIHHGAEIALLRDLYRRFKPDPD
jgi:hypothetical protein